MTSTNVSYDIFRDPEPFDWYQRYDNLKGIIRRYIRQNENILMVGCGNSSKLN